jgi:PAS domain S-box-containing protein
MRFEYSPLVIPLLIAGLISIWVAIYAYAHRVNKGATLLLLLGVAIAEWSICYAFEIAGANLFTKVLWAKLEYAGIVTIPVLWFVFCLQQTNRSRWLEKKNIILLLIVPLITLILVWTTEFHGLVWQSTQVFTYRDYSFLSINHGSWFWVHTVYSYILLIGGTISIIIRMISRIQGIFRNQAIIMLVAVLAPWIGNLVYLLGIGPYPNLDLTPFTFVFSVIVFAWGIFGYQLNDLTPIARSTVVDEMEPGIVVLDISNRIVDINPSALSIINSTEKEATGRYAAEIFAMWPAIIQSIGNPSENTTEITINRGEEPTWYEVGISSLKDRQKGIAGRVITIANITERKQTEVLLRENEERFRQIVENVNEIIYRTDIDGYFIYVNNPTLHNLGFENETEVLGRHFLELASPVARQEMKLFYDHQIQVQEPNTYFEFPAIRADGREIWIGQNVQLIKENDQVIGFQAVAWDITELKRARDAMEFARDQALETSRLKSQLLSNVSHELRTPLGGILGFAELLQMNTYGALNKDQSSAIAQIIDSVHYLSSLIEELLDQAQIEAKTIKLKNEPFSPREVLHNVETNLGIMAHKKELVIRTSISSKVPEMIVGDEKRVQQILINLVGNAIKFTDQGEVTIHMDKPNDDIWALEVTDTGTGISKTDQEHIFDPFFRARSAGAQNKRGAGLGLSISKQLVEIMGGSIALKSKVGQGSAFTVTLPLIVMEKENHE